MSSLNGNASVSNGNNVSNGRYVISDASNVNTNANVINSSIVNAARHRHGSAKRCFVDRSNFWHRICALSAWIHRLIPSSHNAPMCSALNV